MKAAITKSFPDTIHRLCCWHILSKLPNKIGALAEKKNVMQRFHDILWRSQTKEVFENDWNDWIEGNNVSDNKWLKDIYTIRDKWVPIFFAGVFCIDMKTTQRSEGMNAFLRSRITEYNTLFEFVVRYESALKSQREKENYLDHKDRYFQYFWCFKFKIHFYTLCIYKNGMLINVGISTKSFFIILV